MKNSKIHLVVCSVIVWCWTLNGICDVTTSKSTEAVQGAEKYLHAPFTEGGSKNQAIWENFLRNLLQVTYKTRPSDPKSDPRRLVIAQCVTELGLTSNQSNLIFDAINQLQQADAKDKDLNYLETLPGRLSPDKQTQLTTAEEENRQAMLNRKQTELSEGKRVLISKIDSLDKAFQASEREKLWNWAYTKSGRKK